MRFDIITIFPTLFDSFKNEALIARAQKKEIISINTHNLRSYADDERGTIDGRPYGGGAGMVFLTKPILKAVKAVTLRRSAPQGDKRRGRLSKVIVFSPKGKKFNQAMARKYAKLDQVVMICGRYEGIDERVSKYIADEEISIGDYVLFGGEIPAMVVMEAVTRLLPGAIGKQESLKDETFNDTGRDKLGQKQLSQFIEYPHYTRPEVLKIKNGAAKVPSVLLSGNHQKIEAWRKKHSKMRT
ncbi:MAG: tRNA (guanosine(37)-N1)-methyltransferase TrmD [Candidatus Yanofskybacteria bacterium]|nr:tRNA (guanosine(37)-N1)-methyltransferase TrmD [Candidatus Yanofskybacteria bacterium]